MGANGAKIVLAASDSESSEYLRSTWRQMLLACLPARYARYMSDVSFENEVAVLLAWTQAIRAAGEIPAISPRSHTREADARQTLSGSGERQTEISFNDHVVVPARDMRPIMPEAY